MNPNYKTMFETYTLPNGVELDNRIVMAPMTNFSSNDDGTVSETEVNYYARRSNGPGMVITACTYVTENGKGFHGQFAGHQDEMIPSLRKLATAIQEQGAKAVLQIFHGGRMCPPELVPNGEIVSASTVAPSPQGGGTPQAPRALTDDEIQSIIHDFGQTTRRAIEAGFDGVEIHGANGYLIQQFFSPHSNHREDHWGGTIEKRLAFPMAVIDEVQKIVQTHAKGPFIVGYRFSPEEPETPGLTMEDTFVLVDELIKKNLDYLHISLTDFWSKPRRGVEDKTKTRIDYIQARIGDKVPFIGVGAIYAPDEAKQALETKIPLLAIGRELIIDPDWVVKIKEGRENEIETALDTQKQEQLVIPDPLWNAIVHTPGWFPIKE